jgi:hypothetical protein
VRTETRVGASRKQKKNESVQDTSYTGMIFFVSSVAESRNNPAAKKEQLENRLREEKS